MDKDQAQQLLEQILRDSGIEDRAVFRPGEVQQILAISYSSFIRFCDAWEPPGTPGRDPRGLESFYAGVQRRVPRQALVAWLLINSSYNRKLA